MTEQAQPQDERMFQLHRIYIKDLSFESPNSPRVFIGEWQPKHELNLNTQVNRVDEITFEVILSVTVTTHLGDQTAFIVEVQQAGLVGVKGFSEQELGPLLGPIARTSSSPMPAKPSRTS
jgi:preprotein translocase subunit SecB